MSRMYIGPLTDTEKSKKLREQSRIEFTKNSNSFSSLNISSSGFIFNTTAYETGSATCAVLSCHPAVGMCGYAFDVTGSYGFKDIPLNEAIVFYRDGLIPGNATAFKPEGALNGTLINAFISGTEFGFAIINPSLYSDLVTEGGYTFRNLDVEADLSFSTCEAYDNYTSNKIVGYQGYGVVGDKTINDGNGGELDSSHCGTIANIMSDHLTQSSCENGSYTLNGVTYSGTDYINWSTLG